MAKQKSVSGVWHGDSDSVTIRSGIFRSIQPSNCGQVSRLNPTCVRRSGSGVA